MEVIWILFSCVVIYLTLIHVIESIVEKNTNSANAINSDICDHNKMNSQSKKNIQEMTYYARTNFLNENIKNIKGDSDGK